MIRDNKWPIYAFIEREFMGTRGPVEETRRDPRLHETGADGLVGRLADAVQDFTGTRHQQGVVSELDGPLVAIDGSMIDVSQVHQFASFARDSCRERDLDARCFGGARRVKGPDCLSSASNAPECRLDNAQTVPTARRSSRDSGSRFHRAVSRGRGSLRSRAARR